MERRLKVLVAAYACSPCRGSEAGVGWGWVNAISRRHDLWVLTGDCNRADIEAHRDAHPEDCANVAFRYVPRTRWLTLEKLWEPSYLWTYRRWQRDAFRLAERLHEQVGFDLTHQLTYVGFRIPGHLWKLDVPFVWGPIGGLENTPWRFLPTLGLRGGVYYAGRNVVNSLHRRCLVAPRRAFRKARGGIIAATEGIRKAIQEFYGEASEVVCEIGPPERRAAAHSVRRDGEPLRICWSGQHLPGKALPLLLRAVAALPSGVAWELHILGDGWCMRPWRRLARRLGIDGKCSWYGWLPRDQAVAVMHDSHAFVITSLKDLTSTVLVEALSQGLPVIALDHCGFQTALTDGCAVKVPVLRPAQVVAGIRDALAGLAADEGLRRRLAAGALERSGAFAWEAKADAVDAIYERIVRAKP